MDPHECSTDKVLSELQEENGLLQARVLDARKLNYRLQAQLLEAITGEELKADLIDKSNPVQIQIDVEEKEDCVIYMGILQIEKAVDSTLKSLNGPENDRKFIKILFEVLYPDSYFANCCLKGLNKNTILEKITSDKPYLVMKNLFANRVNADGNGDIAQRNQLFGDVVRKKLNNWWKNHSAKYIKTTQ